MSKQPPMAMACAVACVLRFVLLEPSIARACRSTEPRVVLAGMPAQGYALPTDGAIALALVFDRVDPLEVFAGYKLRVLKDGQQVPGIVQYADFTPPAAAGQSTNRLGIISFKPESPFAPESTYSIVLEEPSMWEPDGFSSVLGAQFTTDSGPQPGLSAPTPVLEAEIDLGLAEVKERACCETAISSCGTSFVCWTIALTVRPVVYLKTSIDPAEALEAYPWVARLDEDGQPIDLRFGWFADGWQFAFESEFTELWTTAQGTFELRADTGVHCFAAGTTSLRDFQIEMGEPWCIDTDVVELPEPKYREFEVGTSDECISEPIIEGVGTLGEARGCSVAAPQTPGWTTFVMLVAFGVLRRRSAAGGITPRRRPKR